MAAFSSGSPVQIRCKGVLFDMDGILVSSLGSVERSWSKWAQLRGVDPELTCQTAHGRRAIETIGIMRPDLDAEKELKVIEDIEIEDNEGLTVLPGVLAMLAALPEGRWTVVTSELGYVPKQFPELSDAHRQEAGEFLQAIEDHDDVHRIWAAIK